MRFSPLAFLEPRSTTLANPCFCDGFLVLAAFAEIPCGWLGMPCAPCCAVRSLPGPGRGFSCLPYSCLARAARQQDNLSG